MKAKKKETRLSPSQVARPVLGIRVPRSTARKLRELARRTGVSVGGFVEELVGKVSDRNARRDREAPDESAACRRIYSSVKLASA